MPIYVARRNQRKGLYLKNQNLMFYLPEMSPAQLDEMIRKQLEKLGITKESDVQAVIDKAEKDYESRVKVDEATREIRRLMQLRADGAKLMQRGFRKWVPAFFRPKKET